MTGNVGVVVGTRQCPSVYITDYLLGNICFVLKSVSGWIRLSLSYYYGIRRRSNFLSLPGRIKGYAHESTTFDRL